MRDIAILIISLGIIFISAGLFTNGVEWLGKKMNLSEGAVGSVLAAVGTALPETIIPLIAILFGVGDAAHEIGIGAILGAPFMLGTLAIFLSGGAVLMFRNRRADNYPRIEPDPHVLRRDMAFFLIVYTIAITASFVGHVLKLVIILGLIAAYICYVYKTFTSGANMGASSEIEPLLFARAHGDPPLFRVLSQVVLAFIGIVVGAKFFVDGIAHLSASLGASPLVIALLIAPVATELPEKINSVIWLSHRKDTLALGNITGAMVFQSSVIPAVGIALTPWRLDPVALLSAMLALLSALVIYLLIRYRGFLDSRVIVFTGGAFYGGYVLAILFGLV
ncbi:sodium:calcium antiporter [Desulfallas sp. Bu1-1]|uniref:sodium:calcium antiporter n=1 Tax=Desulfallas sp. Bu1-1 TaxID=2787620 RepID=UPI00189CEB1B|nr:sodium:calcium antiporter [Desulfallas sp. Bu1-1]MBF7083723.1 sodium:calcium antiporter [Desulfallas sp. Bu1-1]